MESRNASFFEYIFPCKTNSNSNVHKRAHETIIEDSQDREQINIPEDQQVVELEPRRSKRARTEKSFGPDFLTFLLENEPQSYNEAVRSADGALWKDAINSEIESILQNHT